MAEYIDLDTPLELYIERGGFCTNKISTLRDLLDTNKIPYTAADVRPVVRGFNTKKDYPSLFECSVCGWECTDTIPCDTEFNFCPNCGADMREES